MKRIIFSMLLASILTILCLAATALIGYTPTSNAAPVQQEESTQLRLDLRQQVPMSVSVQVEVQTTGTQTISVPLLLDLQSLIILAEQEPISALLTALISPAATALQTVTVSMPTSFTPQVSITIITPTVVPTETLVITSTVPVTGSAQVTDLVPTSTVNANLRALPSTESDIVGQVIGGNELTITGQNADGSWYQLDNGSWIVAFVVANAPPDLPVIVDNAVVITRSFAATVTVQALILRAGPGTESDRVGAYAEGSVVAVTGRAPGNEWVSVVTADGDSGWMFVEFLELSVPIEQIPVVITTQENVIAGRIEDEDGEGVNGILIAALQQGDGGSLRVDATSTATGTFFIYVPPSAAGAWRLEIVGLGCNSRIVDDGCQLDGYYFLTPTLAITVPTQGVVALMVAESSGFLAGSVVDENGEPAPEGTRLNASREEDGARTFGVTTDDGRFVLPAATGTWAVTVEDGPVQLIEVPEDGSSEPVELTLP